MKAIRMLAAAAALVVTTAMIGSVGAQQKDPAQGPSSGPMMGSGMMGPGMMGGGMGPGMMAYGGMGPGMMGMGCGGSGPRRSPSSCRASSF
jgi:hypothetical protein